MPIYYGSNKISAVYNSSESIKELYNGSDLVYKKNTALKCFYGLANDGVWASMVYDKYELGSVASMRFSRAFIESTQYPTIIQTINGSLGTSGSTIDVLIDTGGVINCSYIQSLTISNKTFYIYIAYGTYFSTSVYAEEGSVVGNYALPHVYDSKSTVTSISDTQFRLNSQGSVADFIRHPEEDCFWSKELGFFNP